MRRQPSYVTVSFSLLRESVTGGQYMIQDRDSSSRAVLPGGPDYGSKRLEKNRHKGSGLILNHNITPSFQIAPGLPKTRSGKIMRRVLRKVAANLPDELGDISTLADPSVVAAIVKNHEDLVTKVEARQ